MRNHCIDIFADRRGAQALAGRTAAAGRGANSAVSKMIHAPARFAVATAAAFCLYLLAPQAANAQAYSCSHMVTAGTVSICISGDNGDRRTASTGLQLAEGDNAVVSVRAHGLTAGSLSVTLNLGGGGSSSTDIRRSAGLVFNLTVADPEVLRSFFIEDDANMESDETAFFSITDANIVETSTTPPSFSRGTPNSVNFGIISNDARTITVTGPATITETNSNVQSSDYTITRAGTAFGAATDVNWRVIHGTTTDADFSATNGTVSFAAGDATKAFQLTVIGDGTLESDETFTVQVSVADPLGDGGTNYGAAAATTINDDDGYTLAPAGLTPVGFGIDEGAVAASRTLAVRYTADDGSTALRAPATITLELTGEAQGHLNTATSGYPSGLLSERAATVADDFASASVTCTIPMGTAHNAIAECVLPAVTDDTLSERVEHFSVALSGGPTGVQYGAKQFHFIRASDPIRMRVDQASYTAGEGTATTVRIHFDGTAAGTTVPSGLTQFRMLFDNGPDNLGAATLSENYRLESPPLADGLVLLGAMPVWERTNKYYDVETCIILASCGSVEDTTAEVDDVQTWQLRGFHDVPVSWEITGGDSDNDGTFQITFIDDDPTEWTVRARGGGIATEDVNEDAAAIALPTTPDTGSDHANTMYFRFVNHQFAARGDTTLTYCLRGTATGGTAAQVAASPTEYDYTWPAGYDPDSTSAAAAEYPGSCNTGRGDFAIPAGNQVYRLGITLNNDSLNEGDETIILEIVNAAETGYPVLVDNNDNDPMDATNMQTHIATRTIKDNDAISVSIANRGVDSDGNAANGFQIPEGRNAEFTVTLSAAADGDVIVAWTIGGDVGPGDYTGTTDGTITIAAGLTEGVISIPLTDDADSASEDLTVTLSATDSDHTAPGTIARSGTASQQSATQAVITFAAARALTLTLLDGMGGNAATTSIIAESDSDAAIWYRAAIASGGTPFTNPAELRWTVTPGDPSVSTRSATAANDFAAVSGTVTMPAMPTTQVEFSITLAGDNRNEDTEYFTVQVGAADADAESGTRSSDGVTGGIRDDDQVRITLSGGRSFPEGSTDVDVVVDFDAELTLPFAVQLLIFRDPDRNSTVVNPAHNAIELGTDLTTGNGYLSATPLPLIGRSQIHTLFLVPAGATTAALTVAGLAPPFVDLTAPPSFHGIADDNVNEADEMFWIAVNSDFSSDGFGDGSGVWGDVDFPDNLEPYTVLDVNPITITVTATAATVAEGQSVQFDVMLTGASGGSDGNFDVLYTLGGLGAGITPRDSGNGRLQFRRADEINNTPITDTVTVAVPFTDDRGSSSEPSMLTLTVTDVVKQPTDSFIVSPSGFHPTGGEERDFAAGEITIPSAPDNQASVAVQWVDFAHEFTLSNPPATLAEPAAAQGTSATYTVIRGGPAPNLANPLEITWSIQTTGAAVAEDFDGATGRVMFSGSETSKEFHIYAAADSLNEPSESFAIRFSVDPAAASSAGGVSLPGAHGAVITDNADDAIAVTISRDAGTPASVAESSAAATFHIALSGGVRTGAVTVPFEFSGLAEPDFNIVTPTGIAANALGGEVVFAADGMQAANDSMPVHVRFPDNDLNEAARMLTLTGAAAGATGLRNAGGGATGYVSADAAATSTGTATVTITDDDAISAGIAVISADAGTATGHQLAETTFAEFRITMDHASAADARVQYAIGGDVEAADYAGATTRTVVIRAGQTSAVVIIEILADADTDAAETMTVGLTEGGHSAAGAIARSGNAGEQSVTVQITELMTVRTLGVERVGEFYVDETDGTVMADYRARVASGDPFTGAADLRWVVTHGDASVSTRSATTAEDFAGDSISGTFRINSGTGETADFAVPIAGDNRNEDTEYFTVNVGAVNPGGDSGTNPTTTGAVRGIRDDDRVEITLSGGGRHPESGPADEQAYLHVDFGAELTRDFLARIQILRGSSTRSNPDNKVVDTNERDTGNFWTGTAPNVFIISQLNAAWLVPAGATTASFRLNTFMEDNLNEADETYWARLNPESTGAHGYFSPATGRAENADGAWGEVVFVVASQTYIIADDDPIEITVTAAADAVTEGRSVQFDITLTGAADGADGNFDLLYTLDGPAGVMPADSGGGSLEFRRRSEALGTQTAGTVTVTIPYTNTLGDGDEASTLTFRINDVVEQFTPPVVTPFGDLSGHGEQVDYAIGVITSTVPQASVTVTWTDDTPDHVFTLSSPPATIAEPAAAQGAPAVFTVMRAGPDVATTIGVTWSIQTAGAAAADFDGATQGSLMFFGSTTTMVFTVNAAVDNLNEGDEDFTINFAVSDSLAAVPPAAHSARITDNADDAIVVAISRDGATPAMITESSTATATFNIVLSGGERTGAVTVPYTFSGAGITAADFDITAPSGIGTGAVRGEAVFSVPVQPNSTTSSVTITLQDDSRSEGTETLTLTGAAAGPVGLRTASGGMIGYASNANAASVMIADNDMGRVFDTQPPSLQGNIGWAAGQRTLWVTTDEAYKVLAYPSGATASSGTPSLTTLDARGFTVVENNGLASAATLSVTSVRVIPQSRAFALTLERAIGAGVANVYVGYRRIAGNAIYDTAVEDGEADPAIGRNPLLTNPLFMLPMSGNTDSDGDGMPDTVEIAIGENPLEAVAPERRPAFSLSRLATPNPVAYSGIREHGVRAHLGYAATGAATVTAYYRSDTFGYDGTYQCAGNSPFPANYAAPLSEGGCAAVDWGDIVPGMEHTIAWLARSADGVWFVRDGGSRLPEQRIERIPELNMVSQSLFTTGTAVVVSARLESAPGETLTLALSRTPVGGAAATRPTVSGAGQTLSVTDTAPVSAVWAIDDLTESGGASRLYRPTTPTAGFSANHPASNQYSLGLVRRTRVTRINAPVPPVLGRGLLFRNNDVGQSVIALEDGDTDPHQLEVPIENIGNIGDTDPGAVATPLNGAVTVDSMNFVAASGAEPAAFRFNMTVGGGLRTAGTNTAAIQVVVTGGYGGVTTATYSYPVVAPTSPLATHRSDGDRDGIADDFDAFDNSDHLPVVVDETAGASAWHHIRPVLPLHELRLGEMTVERLAMATMNDEVDDYAEYSASETPPSTSNLAVIYDFEIDGVDYAEVTEEGRVGGAAGVIIPLPRSLYDSAASLVKYPSNEPFSVEGANDYGFATLQEDGACPDDTMTAGSPYREGETLRRAKRGGDACLVVYIVDGGANDEDGMANGIIKDPLGIRAAAAAVGGGGGRSHSGSFSVAALAVLSLLLLLLPRTRRRRTA